MSDDETIYTTVATPPARNFPQQSITPAQLLQIAVERGDDLVKLEKLMDLQERWEAKEAKKAYVTALARFKAVVPLITKEKAVSFANTSYHHATLGNIVATISPALGQNGLAFQWFTNQADGRINVRCVLTHDQGHEVEVSMSGAADTSGGKNAIQAIGSTTSYLQRYTLTSILGLSTMDGADDDDGRASSPPVEEAKAIEVLDESQVSIVRSLLKKCAGDEAAFCKRMKVRSVEDMPAAKFALACKALNDKLSTMTKEAP